MLQFLADRSNGRAYATLLPPSFICLSVALCIMAKRCVVEQKLPCENTLIAQYFENNWGAN